MDRAVYACFAFGVALGLGNCMGAGDSTNALQRAPFRDPVFVGTITNPAIREASGLACSRRRDDILWVLNDSGNPSTLYAVATNGASVAGFAVKGVANLDWEDMASFRLDGRPFLLVGDIGDNNAKRATRFLHVVAEPEIPVDGVPARAHLPVEWSITFQYEDGPRDCESVAVDVAAETVLLLSKRTLPPVLYELPLRPPDAEGVATAKRIGEMRHIPPVTKTDLRERWGKFNAQPTAMDLSADGTRLAVLTYKDAYLYTRRPGLSWAECLEREPQCLLLPDRTLGVMLGREALCFDRDSGNIYVTAEGTPTFICRLEPEPRK